MNQNPNPDPDDGRVDQLLARRYRDTSPAFEARWTALKRELRQAPAARRWPVLSWATLGWLGALGAAAALVLVITHPRPAALPSAEAELSPQLAELLAMDAVLERARPLLDEENRTVLLNLPAEAAQTR